MVDDCDTWKRWVGENNVIILSFWDINRLIYL